MLLVSFFYLSLTGLTGFFKPQITPIDECHECLVEVKKSFIRVICVIRAIRGKGFNPVNPV